MRHATFNFWFGLLSGLSLTIWGLMEERHGIATAASIGMKLDMGFVLACLGIVGKLLDEMFEASARNSVVPSVEVQGTYTQEWPIQIISLGTVAEEFAQEAEPFILDPWVSEIR
jgi:hypothetical protein